jgi:hypothetical protein
VGLAHWNLGVSFTTTSFSLIYIGLRRLCGKCGRLIAWCKIRITTLPLPGTSYDIPADTVFKAIATGTLGSYPLTFRGRSKSWKVITSIPTTLASACESRSDLQAGPVCRRDPRCMVISHISRDSMLDVTPMAPVHFIDPF